MKVLHFTDIEDLCLFADEAYSNNNDILFVCKYDDAKEIIQELLYYDYSLINVELEEPDFSGYRDEYYISIYNDNIWCEKAKNSKDDIYLLGESDIVLISGDSNSGILKQLDSNVATYEYSLDGDCDNEYDDFCDCCYDHKKEDCFLDETDIHDGEINVHTIKDGNDVHGFSLSKYEDGVYSSYSYYGSEVLDEDRAAKILDKINF